MILIKSGRVMDPASGFDKICDLKIADGKITEIGSIADDGSYDEVIDARGFIVAPGLVDVHVHFRDPGFTYKEDIYTGAAAAAAGGYTTVVCMANTKPAIDCVEIYESMVKREEELPIHVKQACNVTCEMKGQLLCDLVALHEAGAPGFTDDGLPIMNEEVLREALKMAKELDVPVSLHEEDPKFIKSPGVNEGPVARHFGVGGASRLAEETMVYRDIEINRQIGAKLEIQHVSSAGTVDIIRNAKETGVRVYAEVTPQHLSMNENDLYEVGTLGRVNPPIRTEHDREELVRGLADGTIDIIATDHAPHAKKEKDKDFAAAPSGMIGLETALSLVMTNVVKPGHMPLMSVLKCMTVNPAELYGFNAGCIHQGSPADLCIFDPDEEWTVSVSDIHSKSQNSPFIGRKLCGRVRITICNGVVVYHR